MNANDSQYIDLKTRKLHTLLIPILWVCIAVILFCLTIIYLTRAELSLFNNNTTTGCLITLLTDIWIPLAWLLAALGYGITFTQLFLNKIYTNDTDKSEIIKPKLLPLPAVIGIALMLWLDHLTGLLGLLQIYNGVFAWIIIIFGLILLYIFYAKNISLYKILLNAHQSTSILNLILNYAWIPAIAVLTIAALSAPGWLWDSEYSGFDVLEYHLQIPHEWFTQGYISPFNHNVYSYLPSYVESAYYNIAVLYTHFADTFRGDAPIRAAVACQILHALITITTALAIGSLLKQLLTNKNNQHYTDYYNRTKLTATFTTGILISIPWIIITGSMAYNELPTLILFIAALSIIFNAIQHSSDSKPKPFTFISAIITGFLLGIACGAKLTSIGMIVIPTIIILLIYIPKNKLANYFIILSGIALGAAIALAPYLIRNTIYTANPVFPFASSIFGSGHWTTEQITRWSNAHKPDPLQYTSITSKLNALWQQGPMHTQCAALWFLAAISAIPAIINRTTRKITSLLLLLIFLQLIFWLFFTHLQSRFLIPVTVPLTIIIALGLHNLLPGNNTAKSTKNTSYIITAIICIIITSAMGFWTAHLFQKQHMGMPTTRIDNLNIMTGAGLSEQNIKSLAGKSPYVYLNYPMRTSKNNIYLIGESTPFYIFNSIPIIWHTTWDTSPLGVLIRKYPEQPTKWVSELHNKLNIDYLLVNFSELNRLSNKDHWYDPDLTTNNLQKILIPATVQPLYQWPPQPMEPIYILYRIKP